MRPRLILVDDHRLVVRGLTSLLERDFDIVATAHCGDELLALLPEVVSDGLLLDLEMPGRSGYQLIPRIRRIQPTLPILILTMLVDRTMADACLGAGASGFVPKDADADELRLAIREVLAGRHYVSPLVPKSSHRLGLEASHVGLHRLTRRQEQIVLMLGEGRSGVWISDELGICPSTVTFHKQNIMRTLGLDCEAELVRYAVLIRAGTA
jgi:DNA-binding NarL/FixJ family response regulator